MNIYEYALGWPWLAATFNVLMIASFAIRVFAWFLVATDSK